MCEVPPTINSIRSAKLHESYLSSLGAKQGEELPEFADSFFAARSMARDRANLGGDAIPFLQEIGPHKDNVYTGMMSSDGLRGWRIDFDPNSDKLFHVNWWVKNGPKKRDGWYYGAVTISNSTQQKYWEVLNSFPRNQPFIGK